MWEGVGSNVSPETCCCDIGSVVVFFSQIASHIRS
jgi:hypothetical protein